MWLECRGWVGRAAKAPGKHRQRPGKGIVGSSKFPSPLTGLLHARGCPACFPCSCPVFWPCSRLWQARIPPPLPPGFTMRKARDTAGSRCVLAGANRTEMHVRPTWLGRDG